MKDNQTPDPRAGVPRASTRPHVNWVEEHIGKFGRLQVSEMQKQKKLAPPLE